MQLEPEQNAKWSIPVLDNDMLKTFVAIAESGSMTKAAKMVFRTPAAVSMQVKKLEDLLECKLFERKSRTTTLSSEGDILLRYARRILRLNHEVMQEFLTPKLDGSIKIGMPEHFGTQELPLILSQFAKTHPNVQVEVVMGKSIDILAKFEDKEIDLAVFSANVNATDSGRMQAIRTDKIVWAYLEGGSAITKRPIPLALAEQGCVWRELALKALDNKGTPYRLAYSSENCFGQLAAVKADLAVGAVPESLVSPPLKQVPENANLPDIGYAQTAMMSHADSSAATRALADFITTIMTDQTHKKQVAEAV